MTFSPKMDLIKVVFPQPLGPIKAIDFPSVKDKFKFSKAVFYCFCETAFSSYRSLAGIFLFQILTLFSLRSALRMYNQKAEADGPQRIRSMPE